MGRHVARAARDAYRWLAPQLSRVGRRPDEPATLDEWGSLLPTATMFAYDPASTRAVLETVELMRCAYPHWKFSQIASGGHMATLTRPDLTNPLIAQFLDH
jgi:hypothetical protein